MGAVHNVAATKNSCALPFPSYLSHVHRPSPHPPQPQSQGRQRRRARPSHSTRLHRRSVTMGHTPEIPLVSAAQLRAHLTPNFCFRLVTLAVQNSALTIIMHYSRVSTPPSRQYSAATAVLMNELLKGTISLIIAFSRVDSQGTSYDSAQVSYTSQRTPNLNQRFVGRLRKLSKEVFSPDCWKLSIPAILYGEHHSSFSVN